MDNQGNLHYLVVQLIGMSGEAVFEKSLSRVCN